MPFLNPGSLINLTPKLHSNFSHRFNHINFILVFFFFTKSISCTKSISSTLNFSLYSKFLLPEPLFLLYFNHLLSNVLIKTSFCGRISCCSSCKCALWFSGRLNSNSSKVSWLESNSTKSWISQLGKVQWFYYALD